MNLSKLRWLFLLAAAIAAARCAFFQTTPLVAGAAIACVLLWLWLSRRKILSLDRESVGLPPRGR